MFDQPGVVRDASYLNKLRATLSKQYGEMAKESDRGVAIFGAAYVEGVLDELFSRITWPHVLFDERRSFSDKVRIAAAFKLVSGDVMGDLKVIQKIRNEAAHPKQTLMSFQAEPFLGMVRNLRVAAKQEAYAQADPRKQFMLTITTISNLVALVIGTARPLDLHRMLVGMAAPDAAHWFRDDVDDTQATAEKDAGR